MPNPFEIKSAELMSATEVANEFVRDHTEHSKLISRSHTIVWGSRGSGKSMHFRFLEPLAQASDREGKYKGDVEGFLKDPNAFVGIYINCRDGVLNREELRRLPDLSELGKPLLHLLLSRY